MPGARKGENDDVRQLNDDYTPEHALRVINQMVPSGARSYVSVVTGVALSSVNSREARMEIGYTVYVNIVRDQHHVPFLDCAHVGPLNDITSLMDYCRKLQRQIDVWTGRALTKGPTAAKSDRTTRIPRRPPR